MGYFRLRMSQAAPGAPAPIDVVRIITRLNVGGPSIQAAYLTTALDARGYRTRLIHGRLGEGEGDMSYLLPADADSLHVPALCRPISPLGDLRALLTIYGEMRRRRPRILHTHMAKAGLTGRVAAWAYNLTRGSAPRLRVVHTYHGHVLEGYFHPAVSAAFIALERLLARLSDVLVAISPAIRRDLAETYRIGRSDHYRVVPLGFDLAAFAAIGQDDRGAARRLLDLPADAPVVTTVGRLTAIKQHRMFLDVVRELTTRHPDVVAVVAGDGELRDELQAYAAQLGIAGHVRWLGWRRDLTTIYAATDVFLLTSRNEGTPVAIIEAMASAVPAVSTDVGGVGDVIDSPQVGTLAANGDVPGLARGVSALFADPTARRVMGEHARRRVVERYSVTRLVDDIARLYGELLSAR
jgi:glycosyltransferase involved in cell wall biosynthesis